MTIETYQYDPETRLASCRLPQAMTIDTVESLFDELTASLKEQPTGLTLIAEQTTQLTTPGIQLVLALNASLAAHGGTLTIEGAAPAFTDAFTDLGLGAWIEERKATHA